jgi:type IV pilus modification protein PilV
MQSDNMTNEKLKEQGFTLIEIIIAMGILAFGLLAMASMQVMAIKTNGKANRITEAATFNMDQIEQIRALNNTDVSIPAIAAQDWQPLGTSGLYQYKINFTADDSKDDPKLSPANYKKFKIEIKSTNPNLLKKNIGYDGISTWGI